MRRWNFFLWASVLALLGGCGEDKPKVKNAPRLSPVDEGFVRAAAENKIPLRFLIAVAQMESEVNARGGHTSYGSKWVAPFVNTAFGVSKNELGLLSSKDSDDIFVQINAYAAWLAKQVVEVPLSADPKNSDEKFTWALHIAQAHHRRGSVRNEIQIIFVKQLIEKLNRGFYWRDPVNGQVNYLSPEDPKINIEEMQLVSQNFLNLRADPGEASLAMLLLVSNYEQKRGDPVGVEIKHCPFSLATCVAMQAAPVSIETASFYAHYLVPQDTQAAKYPIQVAKHRSRLPTLTDEGKITYSDRVIIMLTGYSGSIQDGSRSPVVSNWHTHWQLKQMGVLSKQICEDFVFYTSADVNRDEVINKCLTINEGIHFQRQTTKIAHWGDIFGFDPDIFPSYVVNSEAFPQEALFIFDNSNVFDSSAPFSLNLSFPLGTKRVSLEHLVRCPDKRLIWETIQKDPVAGKDHFIFHKQYQDAGVNGDGSHFFRAKLYDTEGKLSGWAETGVWLRNYDVNEQYVPTECGLLWPN